jgi:hypothetical protein
VGVTATDARGTGSLGSGNAWGVTGEASWFSLTNLRLVSYEDAFTAAAGGGTGGFLGKLSGRALLGVRGYFTDWDGPFARVGADMSFARFYSYLRVPLAALGYEHIRGRLAFDIAVTGAYATSGSFGIYKDGGRDLGGSPVVGAYSWLASDPVFARLEWQRLFPPAGGPGSTLPIDVVQSSSCIARRFGAWPLMVCFDVGLYDGRSLRPGTGDLIPTLGISEGISVGLGGVGTGASGEGKEAR